MDILSRELHVLGRTVPYTQLSTYTLRVVSPNTNMYMQTILSVTQAYELHKSLGKFLEGKGK